MSSFTFKDFIQIAGIIDKEEAGILIEEGIKYLGFPLRLPVNKEDLSENDAAEIISTLKPPVYGIIISYSSTADEAISLCRKLGSRIIQLHGTISTFELEKIKREDPSIIIIKSLVVRQNNESELMEMIKSSSDYVDAFITDTFDPETGASGATGRTHDWHISKKLNMLSPKPLILAGGLTPDNVYDAIIEVGPAGVDVHTGVENSTGRKDRDLVTQFITNAKKAFDEIGY